ncbi:MAG: hypothetical protein IPO91_14515 [Chloroflexi bacterium]|nr:hypothetical protein [Chloroflexota bacterium]
MKLISKVEMSLMTWLERARDEGTPLIDGDQVTFVWYGEGAEPAPILVGDFNDWDGAGRPIRLEQVEPDVWAHTLTLPADAYIEYAYMLSREERLADPFNPHVVWNGMDAVNHVFIMPECDLTDLVARKKGVQRGTVTRHLVEAGSTVARRAARGLPLSAACDRSRAAGRGVGWAGLHAPCLPVQHRRQPDRAGAH